VPWTADQVAGLVAGACMAATVVASAKVDNLIARAQRKALGLCAECGGLECQECADGAGGGGGGARADRKAGLNVVLRPPGGGGGGGGAARR